MKKSNFLLTVTTCVLLCVACKKTSTNPQNNISNGGDVLTELENYCHVADIKADGTFFFESNVTNNDSTLVKTVEAGGNYFDNQAGSVANGGGTLTIGSHHCLPNAAGIYSFDAVLPQKGFYGVNVSFGLTPPPSQIVAGAIGTVAASLYSPKVIYITNIPPIVEVTAVKNTPLPITWNADPANPNGVFIICQYSPIRLGNQTALNDGYSTGINKSIHVPDNGSTIIPWSFLAQFPHGGNLTLTIGRGNFTTAVNGAYKYVVGGYTTTAIWDLAIP